jgi:hypothetical protein
MVVRVAKRVLVVLVEAEPTVSAELQTEAMAATAATLVLTVLVEPVDSQERAENMAPTGSLVLTGSAQMAATLATAVTDSIQ